MTTRAPTTLRRWAERALLVVLVLIAVWLAWDLQRTRLQLTKLTAKVDDTVMRLDAFEAARRAALAAPPPAEMFQPPSARRGGGGAGGGGRRGGGGAAVADGGADDGPSWADPDLSSPSGGQRVPEVPGSKVLNLLYDAADRAAVEEDWDADTYDQVARVFEKTTRTMVDLVQQFKDGDIRPADARRRALNVREQAEGDLKSILGADGFERLQATVKEELPPWAPKR